RPVQGVSVDRSVSGFLARYGRWSVMHHQAVGTVAYSAELLANPVLLAGLALALRPSAGALAVLTSSLLVRALCGALSTTALRDRRLRARVLVLGPLRDISLAWLWLWGLVSRTIEWRSHRLEVGPGTRLSPPRRRLASRIYEQFTSS